MIWLQHVRDLVMEGKKPVISNCVKNLRHSSDTKYPKFSSQDNNLIVHTDEENKKK